MLTAAQHDLVLAERDPSPLPTHLPRFVLEQLGPSSYRDLVSMTQEVGQVPRMCSALPTTSIRFLYIEPLDLVAVVSLHSFPFLDLRYAVAVVGWPAGAARPAPKDQNLRFLSHPSHGEARLRLNPTVKVRSLES
jgi:hypothetical protein